MRDKFIEISLNDLVAKDLLYQHDKGQFVRFIEEIEDGTLVLFNNSNLKEDAIPRYLENCCAEIPDRLLETDGSLIVTVKLVDSNSETTQKVIKIKIKSGSKQNEEIEPENQQTFIEQIQGIMTATKSIAEDVQERAEEKIKTNEAVLEQIDDKANEAVETIEQTKNDAVGVLVDEKDAVLNEVGGAKTTALNDIANREKSAIDTIETAETTAKDNIQAKTTESLNTIGEKSTAVLTEIETLKNSVEQSETNASQSAEEARQTAEELSADRNQINVNKSDIAELNDKKITKFYANNLGETTLKDSDNGKIQDMMIFGKSEQFATSGAQLLNLADKKSHTQSGVTVSITNGVVTLSAVNTDGPVSLMGGYVNKTPIFTLPAGTYTTSKEIALRDYTGDSMINYGRGTFTLENDTPITDVAIATNNGVKGENYPMLCKGSALLDWEPYTGGQPSPNPDYPQEIKSVVNPKVTVSGAQLQSKGGNNYNKNGITVDYVNGTEITIKGTATASVNTVGLFLKNLKENTTYTLSLYGIDFTKINAILGHSGKLSNVSKTFNSGLYTKRFLDFTIEEGTTVDCTFKLMLNEGSTALPYEPYKEQVATLPYELNAIPVSSGGNVTIDGQQYVADYVDVERGKLVRMVDDLNLDATVPIVDNTDMLLATPIEIDLTDEEVQLFKDLSTYYPHTHVMVKSEQLDGYTTFNYPISLANGWNYVKEQLGDTREFIYDMELQSAEAYVNSEYAVAIAELEV